MAIAFRGVGARMKEDVSNDPTHEVSMPAGVVAGDLLLLVYLQDCRNPETGPPGWNLLTRVQVGVPVLPFILTKLAIYWRIADGSEGISETVTISTANYPAGDPYAMACILAWSGTHATAPIVEWAATSTQNTAAAQAHPQLTTGSANSWLVTVRSSAANGALSFTASGGTNTERVDDTWQNELGFAVYDSNGPLAAGVQTQRTTTADRVCDWGSALVSLALRPPDSATSVQAAASLASATGTALDASAHVVDGPWALCGPGGLPTYSWAIDWDLDGTYTDPGEDVTADVLSAGVTWTYGRDQDRQLSPAQLGTAGYSLINVERTYSPENTASPLYGNLDAARPLRGEVSFLGTTHPLFTGRINEYTVQAARSERTAAFTFLDAQSILQGTQLSTEVFFGIRTGTAVGIILDRAGWTGPRDIDPGATVIPVWWLEETEATQAIQDLVKSEGPPSIAYADPSGTFVFRDRHHRILRERSSAAQASFAANLIDCADAAGSDIYTGATATATGTAMSPGYLTATDADAADIHLGVKAKLFTSAGVLKENTVFTVVSLASAGGSTDIAFTPEAAAVTVAGDQLRVGLFPSPDDLHYTDPLIYEHGWRDIVNSVTFEVEERSPKGTLEPVWSSDSSLSLALGQSTEIQISAGDPFTEAQTPVAGVDYTLTGAGTAHMVIDRTSGRSLKLSILAIGGAVVVQDLQVRAKPIPVVRTTKVSRSDTASIDSHGEKAYGETAPWAGPEDAYAIASRILLHYAERRPTVQLRVVAEDPRHYMQVLQRTISDRIHIVNAELGLDDDFFVERVVHTLERMNRPGSPPVHAVVLGCEKQLTPTTGNPFTFDKRGAGFDDGVWDPISSDDAESVFVFDDPDQGQFDVGLFGT